MTIKNKLFHYTTANGLLGILTTDSIWSTAYHCANDTSEFSAGSKEIEKICKGRFEKSSIKLQSNDVDDQILVFIAIFNKYLFEKNGSYISCFFEPSNVEEVDHGSLSQWRGYGSDGGYALEINKNKLECSLKDLSGLDNFHYALDNVNYNIEVSVELSCGLEKLGDIFLDFLRMPLTIESGLSKWCDDFLDPYLKFIAFSKNKHFSSESEVRMACVRPLNKESDNVDYFIRNGLIVPYIKTPKNFKFLECIESIVVGPSPRMKDRASSIRNLVSRLNLKINVKLSGIPYTRE